MIVDLVKLMPALVTMYLWGYGDRVLHQAGIPRLEALAVMIGGMLTLVLVATILLRGRMRDARFLAITAIAVLLAVIASGLVLVVGAVVEALWRRGPGEGLAPVAGRALWHAAAAFVLVFALPPPDRQNC